MRCTALQQILSQNFIRWMRFTVRKAEAGHCNPFAPQFTDIQSDAPWRAFSVPAQTSGRGRKPGRLSLVASRTAWSGWLLLRRCHPCRKVISFRLCLWMQHFRVERERKVILRNMCCRGKPWRGLPEVQLLPAETQV